MTVAQVRALLQQFQDGYAARDPARLDAFMELFVPTEELEIIGTNAVEPGQGEWCQGRDAARALVAGDWKHWGDVRFDVAGARIWIRGDVAWSATTGTVTDTIPVEDRTTGYLEFVQDILNDQGMPTAAKLREIVQLGNVIVLGLPLPEIYVWPFRFTAVAVRDGQRWRFHQMQFSFATTGAPDVRYLPES